MRLSYKGRFCFQSTLCLLALCLDSYLRPVGTARATVRLGIDTLIANIIIVIIIILVKTILLATYNVFKKC